MYSKKEQRNRKQQLTECRMYDVANITDGYWNFKTREVLLLQIWYQLAGNAIPKISRATAFFLLLLQEAY